MDRIIRIKVESGEAERMVGQLDSSMVRLGTATDKTTAEVAGLNTQLTKTAQGVKSAVNTTNQSIGNFGRTTGQAAIQVQQLVGQIQGGVSPFVALSQQAADLGFVLGFPLLGAVVGIAASLAGPLAAAFLQAEEKADAFDDALRRIKDTQDEFKANAAIAEISSLNREFDKQQQVIESLSRQQQNYIEIISKGGTAQASYAAALSQIGGSISEAQALQAELAKKIEDVTAASLSSVAATIEQDDKLETLNSTLKRQSIALNEGELQAKLYAASQYLALDAVSELPSSIRDQITAIYELEEAQKRQREQAAKLLQQTREDAQAKKELERDEVSAQRRADRDQSRINERIAALRLETQTLSSELILQKGVRDGFISQEQAQLDMQTSNRVQQAVSERELLLAEKNITDQQRLDVESAYNSNLLAITQSYEEQKTEVARQQALTRMQIESDTQQTYLETTQIALGALTNLVGGSSAAVKAMKLIQAGANAFQIYAASETAAALILATPPGPVLNPSLIGLSNAVRVRGKISAGAVLAAGAASTFSGGGGGGGSFSGGSSGSSALPTTPQSAPTVQTLEISGLDEIRDELRNQDGMVSTRFVATILDKISDANRIRGEG
jgi:hypothetical protein